MDFFFEYEFIVLTIYTPNMAKLRDNGVSVAVTAGEESGDAYYVRRRLIRRRFLAAGGSCGRGTTSSIEVTRLHL
jgi:hypothetical protein